jgi:hypothetical protein
VHRHIGNQPNATAIVDTSGFLFEGGGVSYQREWSELIAVQVDADDDLIGREQVILVYRDRSLDTVKRGYALDLDRDICAVAEPVDQPVDAAIEHRQEDV